MNPILEFIKEIKTEIAYLEGKFSNDHPLRDDYDRTISAAAIIKRDAEIISLMIKTN